MTAWLRKRASLIILLTVIFGSEGAVFWLVARTAATEVQLCEAGNEFRAQQYGTWNYVIRLSGPPRTARARAVLARFEEHLRAELAPRNCQAPLTTRSTP